LIEIIAIGAIFIAAAWLVEGVVSRRKRRK